jgi:ribosomal protein S18 acetylase RimI-like enzyme
LHYGFELLDSFRQPTRKRRPVKWKGAIRHIFSYYRNESVGIVAIGTIPDQDKTVYICDLGAFQARRGIGSLILKALCDPADRCNVTLTVSAIVIPNGRDPEMTTEQLIRWYKRFGFTGSSGMFREPAGGKK